MQARFRYPWLPVFLADFAATTLAYYLAWCLRFHSVFAHGMYDGINRLLGVDRLGSMGWELELFYLAGAPRIILLLTAITAAPIWGPRPQIISFLFVAILDYWLDKRGSHPWILVPLFALWANLHGGWIWGFLLLLAHIAGNLINLLSAPSEEKTALWQKAKRLLGWSALAMLAVGLNPNGLALWKLPFEQVNVSMQIQEWLSPDFHRLDFHPFLWILFLLLLAAPLAGKPNWPRLFKVIGFAYLTFVAQRNIALFANTKSTENLPQ